MTDQPTTPAGDAGKTPFIFYGITGLLICSFLWRALTPAHEYPGATSTYLEMAVDAGLLVGLFGIRAKGPAWLFWIALIAGLGLFAIRFNSNASWWTGHLRYWVL